MTRTTCSTWTMITPWLTCQPSRPIITAWHHVDGSPLYPHTLSLSSTGLWLSSLPEQKASIHLRICQSDAQNWHREWRISFLCAPRFQNGTRLVRKRLREKRTKDRGRQRREEAESAESRSCRKMIHNRHWSHRQQTATNVCVICGGLWGFEFPPTVASFYAHLCVCGRRQMPVQCDTSADRAHNRCVCGPSARGYHHWWKTLWRQKLRYGSLQKKEQNWTYK